MTGSGTRDSDREHVAGPAVGVDQAKAGTRVDVVTVGVNASDDVNRSQGDGSVSVDHETSASFNFGENLPDRGRYELNLVIDDLDQDNMVIAVSRHHRHAQLLNEGWYPIRWRHPKLGDLEMVMSDRFWVFRRKANDGGIVIGPPLAVDAALADGRGKFVRDADGNLIAVSSDGGDK